MKRDIYAEVSARIIAELERGAAPWVKPWSVTPGQNVPQNAVTNRPYSGCNVILLWLARNRGWATPRFAELFRTALRADSRRATKSSKAAKAQEITDYNVDRLRLRCRSPRIAVRFMDGEAVLTRAPSAPGKPLNIGRALRVAIAMYRSRRGSPAEIRISGV
jgi:N-terminal domain of anti-restriction factor ArdC